MVNAMIGRYRDRLHRCFGHDGAVSEDRADDSRGRLDASGRTSTIEIGGGTLDLDHLVSGHAETVLRVAAIENVDADQTSLSLGQPASAHGSATLGVPGVELEAVLGQPPFDFEAAAAALGISAAELEAAFPPPAG